MRIIFGVISFFFLLAIFFFLTHTTWIKVNFWQDWMEFLTYRPLGVKKITKTWKKITRRIETGLEFECKLAIVETDDLLNDILKKMGYSGETLPDKLNKLTSVSLPNLDQVREVHKIRNNIVHDPDYQLNIEEARKTLAIYEQALQDLQMF